MIRLRHIIGLENESALRALFPVRPEWPHARIVARSQVTNGLRDVRTVQRSERDNMAAKRKESAKS